MSRQAFEEAGQGSTCPPACFTGRSEHDSFKLSNDKWYWHSRGFGGHSAYDYLTKVQGMGFRDAIQALLDGGVAFTPAISNARSPPKPQKKGPLVLPKANKNNDAVIAYLQGRGIGKAVIQRCIDNGSLYESANGHGCVFVGFSDGRPRYACVRSTKGNVKQDVRGSDKRHGFLLPSKKASNSIVIFESAVDLLSHATLYDIGAYGWDGNRLSLGGVSSLSLAGYLEGHMETKHVQLSLDKDKAGEEATNRIIKELLSDHRFRHIKITVAPPPLGMKDFNDTLQAVRKMQMDRPKPNRSKEADFLF